MRRVIFAVLGVLLIAAGWFLYDPDKQRAALEAVYAQPPSVFVEVAGVRLHVRDTGPRGAPAVVLLHGFGASLHTWEGWAGPLSRGFRVVRLDLPAFGLTGADPSGVYTDERTIAVLAGLLDRLGIGRAVLVGHSMGGRVAWRFAVAHPARVSRLVLVSPDGFAGPGEAYGRRAEVPLLMRVLPYTLPAFLVRMNTAPAYADGAKLSAATLARYRDMLLAPGVRGAILARMAQHVLPDPVPMLRTLGMPVLLLWGAQDRMIPASNAQDYLAAVPGARLVRLDDLGHVPQEEAPEESLIPVMGFLNE